MTKASLILIALAMVISSCGNSGRGRPRGQHCPSSYDPISLEQTAEGTQKISLDPKDSQLVEGLYEYAGAEIFYHDSEEDIKIHVKEFVGADGKTTPGNVCVRGLKQKIQWLLILVEKQIFLSDAFN